MGGPKDSGKSSILSRYDSNFFTDVKADLSYLGYAFKNFFLNEKYIEIQVVI